MIMLNLITLKCIQVCIDAKYFHKRWQHRRSISWGMSQSVIALLGFVFEHEHEPVYRVFKVFYIEQQWGRY